MKLTRLEDVHFVFVFCLAVNKQITDKTHTILEYLIAEHSGLIKYTLNKY